MVLNRFVLIERGLNYVDIAFGLRFRGAASASVSCRSFLLFPLTGPAFPLQRLYLT